MKYVTLATMIALASGAAAMAEQELDLTGTWRVAEIHGVAEIDSDKTEFVVDESGALAATLGCNRMKGTIAIDGSVITLGPMASTLMACPPGLGEAEAVFQAALADTAGVSLDDTGQSARLLNGEGEHLATLIKAP